MDSTVSPQLSGKMGVLIGLIANVTRVVGEWTVQLVLSYLGNGGAHWFDS